MDGMHIGEVAARTDLSIRSLRHWEDVGLLRPSGRTVGGFRVYTEDDVDKILAIRRMKPLGFSLDEMRSALGHLETLRNSDADPRARDTARAHLAAVRGDAVRRRETLVRHLAMADEFLAILERESAS